MNTTDHDLSGTTLALLVATIAVLSFGQILFKRAADVIEFARPASFVSLPVVLALGLYALATLMWLYVLSRVRLSVAFPFYGLSFVFVPLLAWALLGEPIGWRNVAGGALIILGLVVATSGARTVA